MDYYSYDIISLSPPPSYSCFGHFCKETKSCSFVLDLDRNSLQHTYTITSMSQKRHIMEFEGQGESIGEKLFLCYGDSSMSFSSNLFLFYLAFIFKGFKLFLDGYVSLEFNLMLINLDRTHLLVIKDSIHDSLVFITHDVEPWNIYDSLGDANHRTFGLLGNNSYGFDGSLFSLLGDYYELKLFLNAYAFHEIIVGVLCSIFRTCDLCLIHVHLSNCLSFYDSLQNQLLTRDPKLEHSCFDIKCWHDILDIISLVIDSFPPWTPIWGMIPNLLDLFKDGFGVLKVCHRVFVETILRKDFLELFLKNFVEKCLRYLKTFIEILWKDVFLDGLLIPNKKSFVISMKHEFSRNLLYYLPFKELLKKLVCKEKFGKDESFQFRYPFKDVGNYFYCIIYHITYNNTHKFSIVHRKMASAWQSFC
ncbi:hypothetical protein M9H77_07867 [Catharanthus roseus]|uniref:Uncharacterized protein n=1 Tax=Catharanthus roseus TaxID=4058 RepID=A0ACC0BWE9_CATRO|nr:hypothetical protein M9H77_07867 [Catharanthus roseus]